MRNISSPASASSVGKSGEPLLLIQKSFTETFSVDSILSETIDFTVDAYLRKQFTTTFTVDAKIFRGVVFGVDAVLISTPNRGVHGTSVVSGNISGTVSILVNMSGKSSIMGKVADESAIKGVS